jgi:hypothetical protein
MQTECPVIDYREYYKNYKPTRRRNQWRSLKRLLDVSDWNRATNDPIPF